MLRNNEFLILKFAIFFLIHGVSVYFWGEETAETVEKGEIIIREAEQNAPKTHSTGESENHIDYSEVGENITLISPEKPTIELSEKARRTVNSPLDVELRFEIGTDGMALRGSFSFIPDALLSKRVRREVEQAILNWQFSKPKKKVKAKAIYHIRLRSP